MISFWSTEFANHHAADLILVVQVGNGSGRTADIRKIGVGLGRRVGCKSAKQGGCGDDADFPNYSHRSCDNGRYSGVAVKGVNNLQPDGGLPSPYNAPGVKRTTAPIPSPPEVTLQRVGCEVRQS